MVKFFINRPIVAMVIAIITLIAGLVCMRGLPVAQFPEIVPPQIQISTSYTGADAVTIEQAVAAPLEASFATVPGIAQMSSTNTLGRTSIVMQFDLDRNIDAAATDVQAAISAASRQN